MEIDSKSRIEEIDMLRGVAIIITVIAHSKLLFLWSPPWLLWIHENFLFGNGVDLFFVISGFVVTRSLLDRFLDWPTFFLEYRFFIIRRFWRLAPAALFFCIFYLIYSLVSRSGEVGSFLLNLKNLVAVVTLTANLRDQSNLMAVYWTLASEWQFYIVLPFVVFIISKSPKIGIFLIFLSLLFLFLFGGDLKFTKLRFDAMIYGVFLAYVYRLRQYKDLEPTFLASKAVAFFVSLFSIFLIVFLPKALAGISASVLLGLVSINCFFLVWISSYRKKYFLGYFSDLLHIIGARSYSIYLAHGPVLYVTHDIWYLIANKEASEIGGDFTLRYFVTFVVLLVVVSEMSYRFLELRFSKFNFIHAAA